MKIIKNDNIQWDRMGVYIFLNKNGKCYIGSTVNIKDRFSSHKSMLENGKHCRYIQRAYDKKTAKFHFDVLEYIDNIEDLRKREAHYIKEYQAMYYQNGYNIFDVNDNGYFCHSEETKNKISEANSGNIPCIDIFGVHGVATKDDPRWETGEIFHNTKNKVSCIDSNGNTKMVTIEEFKNSENLFGVNKGKSTYKDKDGNSVMVSVDDPRVLSGELVGVTKGVPSPFAKEIIVDGIIYRSLEEAYTTLGISKPTFRKLINSKKYTVSTNPLVLELNGYKPRNGKRISIDGIEYKSIFDAESKIGISAYRIKNRLDSKDYSNYIYLD